MINENRVLVINEPVTREILLGRMADLLKDDGVVKDSFPVAILDREKSCPTGIDIETHAIAIPHTEYEHVNHTGFAMAVTHGNVEFCSADDITNIVTPDVVIMMAIDANTEKVEIIQNIFAWLADVDEIHHVMNLNDKDSIAELFMDKVAR
ncbi:PTS sugar transporter subunit IIA [Vibrio mediterranei]